MKYLILFLLFLTACTKHEIVQDGASYTYVVVRLEFLSEIKQFCSDSIIPSEYENEEKLRQARAKCVLENLSIFNFDTAITSEFDNEYCSENADLSQLTEEQRADAIRVCQILGGH